MCLRSTVIFPSTWILRVTRAICGVIVWLTSIRSQVSGLPVRTKSAGAGPSTSRTSRSLPPSKRKVNVLFTGSV